MWCLREGADLLWWEVMYLFTAYPCWRENVALQALCNYWVGIPRQNLWHQVRWRRLVLSPSVFFLSVNKVKLANNLCPHVACWQWKQKLRLGNSSLTWFKIFTEAQINGHRVSSQVLHVINLHCGPSSWGVSDIFTGYSVPLKVDQATRFRGRAQPYHF